MNNKSEFWAELFSRTETKGEAFEIADKVFNKMKKKGKTKAWSISEMEDQEFLEALGMLNDIEGKLNIKNKL